MVSIFICEGIQKQREEVHMKYIKILVVLFTVVLISACNTTEDSVINRNETTGIILTPVTDDEIIEELEHHDPMPHITIDQNQVILLDLITGEALEIYEFDQQEIVNQVWDFGNGYYAAWGGMLGFDAEGFVENDFRIVIFDENLNPLETLLYDEIELPVLFFSVLRMVDGELFVYGQGWNENWATESMTNFLRVNVHTGEVTTLFEIEHSLRLHEFISDNQILVFDQTTDWNAGRVHTQYGVLDLDTGEVQLFEREGFAQGHVDFHESRVLIAERHVTTVVNNEVIIFDLADMSSTFIQLEDEESISVRFSHDGNYIVTINEEQSVFRKYDFNGVIVAEIEIDLPSTVTGEDEFELETDTPTDLIPPARLYRDFQIFSITEEIYVIHTHLSLVEMWIFLSDHYIQLVRLP